MNAKSDNSRQAVLDAAYRLFVKQGFHATSMREIAQQAGISLGAIYNHFENKEQIFDKMLLEKHPFYHVLEALQTATGDSLEDFIRSSAQMISDELVKRPEFLHILFIEWNEFHSKHTPLLMQTIYPQFLTFLRRMEGERKQLRDIPSQVVALSFAWLLVGHYLGETTFDPDGVLFDRKAQLDHYLEIFLHGILIPANPLST